MSVEFLGGRWWITTACPPGAHAAGQPCSACWPDSHGHPPPQDAALLAVEVDGDSVTLTCSREQAVEILGSAAHLAAEFGDGPLLALVEPVLQRLEEPPPSVHDRVRCPLCHRPQDHHPHTGCPGRCPTVIEENP